MKKIIILSLALASFIIPANAQNTLPKKGSVGIGTTAPNASAILDVDTVGKGVLIPRMTKVQRDAIVSPATSLLLYQTDNTAGFYYFDATWKPVTPTPVNEVQLQNNNLFVVGNYQIPITTGDSNTVVGSAAFNLNTTGRSNAVFGNYAMALNTSGWGNTAMGYRTLMGNTGGYENVAIGYGALMNSTFGIYNTVVGAEALMNQTATGWGNAVFGQRTLVNNSGDNNAAFGSYSMMNNTSGGYNVCVGVTAMNANTTGKHNTAIGNRAMLSNTTGTFNTVLGDSANVSSGNLTNAMALGYKAVVNASNKVVVGNAGVKVIGGQVGWSTFSDGRFKTNIHENVPGLAFINKLKPVTYNLALKKFDQFLGRKDNETNSNQADYAAGEKKIRTGFIAQDVEKSAQELHYDFDGVNHPEDDKDNYSLVYADFVVPLVKAVQELSQQNEKLNAEMQQMKDEIAMLKGTKIVSSSNADAVITNDKTVLGQNQPNPFGSQTIIPVKLPPHFSSASVVIAETTTGRILKTITVTANTTQLTLDANSFAAGTFTYSLFVDGKRTDTKQMVHIGSK